MENRSKVFRGGSTEIWRREMGLSQPRSFTRRVGGSEVWVLNFLIFSLNFFFLISRNRSKGWGNQLNTTVLVYVKMKTLALNALVICLC